jgi:hypothetical protein
MSATMTLDRCERCGWPLATDTKRGCVPGDCSCRCSLPDAFCECIQRAKRQALRARAAAMPGGEARDG